MPNHYNSVQLIGNLTQDPDLSYTKSNTAVADFGLAVNRKWKDQSGSPREEVSFVDITVWGRLAENCSKYLEKGSPVFIQGRLDQDRWENDGGGKRSKIYVTAQVVNFLHGGSEARDAEPNAGTVEEIEEGSVDDIPF